MTARVGAVRLRESRGVGKLQKFSITDILENMKTIKLQQRGILTLPKKLRDQLGLTEGQSFRVEAKDNQIILEPELSAHDRQLMEDIKESLEDLKHGRYIEFSTLEEFDEKMKQYEDSLDE